MIARPVALAVLLLAGCGGLMRLTPAECVAARARCAATGDVGACDDAARPECPHRRCLPGHQFIMAGPASGTIDRCVPDAPRCGPDAPGERNQCPTRYQQDRPELWISPGPVR